MTGGASIKRVSRFFALSFEIDLICAVFRETNAKALFVLFSVNGNFDNLPIVARHKAFVDMVNNKLIIDLLVLNGIIEM